MYNALLLTVRLSQGMGWPPWCGDITNPFLGVKSLTVSVWVLEAGTGLSTQWQWVWLIRFSGDFGFQKDLELLKWLVCLDTRAPRRRKSTWGMEMSTGEWSQAVKRWSQCSRSYSLLPGLLKQQQSSICLQLYLVWMPVKLRMWLCPGWWRNEVLKKKVR